ncbi:hypothetical protein MIR68_003251 [Amoeboaphelidium protococcarum]|nr:hypothetical protein MIR68_003251 [Amoeboaphelidium protococcarum]
MADISNQIVLYSYWRSSCSWRVRIALNFKGIPYQYRAINLLQAEQQGEEYVALNPAKSLPTLLIDGLVLTQSVAILEYLEERKPESWRLLPVMPAERAKVRALVNIVCCDIQPVQNMKVLKQVGEDKKAEWAQKCITSGFEALEKMLQQTAGTYCVGDQVSLADVCLVPQVYNANRFQVDMTKFPLIQRINASLEQLEPFQKAHPDQQPDNPSSTQKQ